MTRAPIAAVPTRPPLLPVLAFAAILVVGLYVVKWHPSLDRALGAAAHHGIGSSILGRQAGVGLGRQAGVGWQAGLAYAGAYLGAVWKALVLGLAVAAGVQMKCRETLGEVGGGEVELRRDDVLAHRAQAGDVGVERERAAVVGGAELVAPVLAVRMVEGRQDDRRAELPLVDQVLGLL